jgi:hypothetical protein
MYWPYISLEAFATTEFNETSESFHTLTRMSAWERFTGHEFRYLVCGVSKLMYPFFWGVASLYWVFRDNMVVSSSRLEISMNLFSLLSSLSLFVQSGRVPFVVLGLFVLLFLCFPNCLFLSCLGLWHGRTSLSPLSILIHSIELFLLFLWVDSDVGNETWRNKVRNVTWIEVVQGVQWRNFVPKFP